MKQSWAQRADRHRQRRAPQALCALEALEPRVLLAAFFVDTVADTIDANPGDGIAADLSGNTSLRAAIMEANALEELNPGADSFDIYLSQGTYVLTRSGSGEDDAATGDLDIKSYIYLNGVGSEYTIIDAGGLDRAFEVHNGGDASFYNVQITGGQAPSGEMGGAIYNQASAYLSVESSLIIDNAAPNGGGIANEGSAYIYNSTIQNNQAASDGGGVYNGGNGYTYLYNTHVTGNEASGNGGGIASTSDNSLSIYSGSVIESNTAGTGAAGGNGGGVYNNGQGYVSVGSSTIDGNTARADASYTTNGQGGGIFNVDGNLDVYSSTISNNTAGRDGGGIWSTIDTGTENSFYLTNATLSGNMTERGNGAGLWVSESGAIILHATIVNNRANTQDIGNAAHGAGLFIDNSVTSPTVQLDRTIIANNTRRTVSPAPDDILGAGLDSSSAYNLIGDAATAGGLTDTVNGNIVGADPMLGPLADNGGPTLTHNPMFGSPAIDAIDDDNQLSYNDQRGVPRNQDGDFDMNALADIGAVEVAYNYVDGGEGSILVFGTDSDDYIEIYRGDGTIEIAVNGNVSSYSYAEQIRVYGLKGNDTLYVEPGLKMDAYYDVGSAPAVTFIGGPDFDTFTYDATGSSDLFTEGHSIFDNDRNDGHSLLDATLDDVEKFELFAGFNPGVGDDITIRDDAPFDVVADFNPPVRGFGELVLSGFPVMAGGSAALGITSVSDTDNLIFIYQDHVQLTNTGRSVTFYNDSGALESLEIYSGPGDDDIQVLTDLLPFLYIDAGDPSASDTVTFFDTTIDDTFDLYDWNVNHNGQVTQLVNVEHLRIDITSAGTDTVNANQGFFGANTDVEVFGADSTDVLNVYSTDADQYGRIYSNDVFLDEVGPGNLRFVEAQFEGGTQENSGLVGIASAAVSPDGGYVYTVSSTDSAVSVFDRDHVDGGLIELKTIYNGDPDGEGIISGLGGARNIVISPDGDYAYVSSYDDNAITILAVYDGDLYVVDSLYDGDFDNQGNLISGLGGSTHAVMSPDGTYLYAVGETDSAISVFERNPSTGELTLVETLFNNGIDYNEQTITGIGGASFVAVHPSGKYVFVAGGDDNAIAVFSRDEMTGHLLFQQVLVDGGDDGSGNTIDGLDGVASLVSTPEGYLYVAAAIDDSISRFDVDPMTGVVTYIDSFFNGGLDHVGNTINGLDGATSVSVSPDGKWLLVGSTNDNGIAVFAPFYEGLNFREFVQDGNYDGFGEPVDGTAGPNQIIFDPSGRHAYVAGQDDDAIATFALPKTLHIIHSGLTDLMVGTGEGTDQVDVYAGGLPGLLTVDLDQAMFGLDLAQVFGTNGADMFDVFADEVDVDGGAIDLFGHELLNLYAEGGDDVVKVNDGANVSIADGGSEFDTLDYSAYTAPASVDLMNNLATGFGNVFNFEGVVPPIAITQSGSIVTMTGTDNADDVIISMPAPGVLRIRIPAFSFDQTFNGESGEGVMGVTFNAGGGDDSLTVDYADGDMILPDGVNYDGQTQDVTGDELIITGNAAPFASVDYEYGAQDPEGNDGSVSIDDSTQTLSIMYDGLEPITNDGNADDVVFNLPRNVDNSDVRLSYNSETGLMELTGSTFEDTFFVMPAGAGASVTINLGNQADAILIDSIDPSFIGTLNVIGGSGADKITGPDSNNTWTLDATGAGSFVDGFTFTFSGIDALMGGAMDDTFVFIEGVNFGGMISGGGGNDTLDYTPFNAPAIVNLGGGTATGTTGVMGVENVVLPTDFVVLNTNDAGYGSLRNAILGANLSQAAATITFAIPVADPGFIDVDDATGLPGADAGKDVWVIKPLSGLPALSNASDFGITIDASSQATFIGSDTNPNGPEVILDGSMTGPGVVDGLQLVGDDNTVRGLAIGRFNNSGIYIAGSNNVVAGNYVGTDATGRTAAPNGGSGIYIQDAADNTVGGSTISEMNLISGNTGEGVYITGAGSTGNNVLGNYIGTDATGATAVGNGVGVLVGNATGTQIGGSLPSERNVISGNLSDGIVITGSLATLNKVQGNYVGVDASGAVALGNAQNGIHLLSLSHDNLIGTDGDGTDDETEGNVISGNGLSGVSDGGGTPGYGSTIAGNIIGLDATGTVALGNTDSGVVLYSAGNTVGGVDAAQRNIISGNKNPYGVALVGAGSTNNAVVGNYIGTDITGTLALGNIVGVGILSASNNRIGGSFLGERNVISGNSSNGIVITGSQATLNKVQGNYIGVDATGSNGLGNGGNGVYLTGLSHANIVGTDGDGMNDATEGNVISDNGFTGVSNGGANSGYDITIAGNIIGLDATGAVAIGNADNGVYLSSGGNTVGGLDVAQRNVIGGNTNSGVVIAGMTSTNNHVLGNYIGTDATGTVARGNHIGVLILGAPDNYIGSADSGGGNLLSGNTSHGILINGATTTSGTIMGNRIGVDATGTQPLGNGLRGIELFINPSNIVIGGSGPGEGNVIGASAQIGILVSGSAANTIIKGNAIGTDPSGTYLFGNGAANVVVNGGATGTVIGGIAPGEGNIIAYANSGILASQLSSNTTIRGNAIFDNTGLGIDLNEDGPTPNDYLDADTGTNSLQNFAIITTADAGTDLIAGDFHGAPNQTFDVDVYASAAADLTGYGEGQRYLGSTTVTTDSLGNGQFSLTAGNFVNGEFLTATATDANGNTSEFSPVFEITQPTGVIQAEFHWINSEGGDWFDPQNWDLNAVPGPGDIVYIDEPGDYEVDVYDDATIGSLTVGGATGEQFLYVDNYTFTVENDATIASGDVMYAAFSTLYFNGALSIEGTLTVEDASDTLAGSGLATIEVGGLLQILSSNSTIDIDNYGTLVAAGYSSISGGFTSEPGSMIIIDSGLSLYGSTQVHFVDGLTNHGTFELTNTDGETNGDADSSAIFGFGSGLFTNASDGVINVTAGEGDGLRSIAGQVDNQGELNLVDTDLSIDGGEAGDLMNGGTVDIGGELQLTFNSPLGSFKTDGIVNAAGATIEIFTSAGVMEVNGGTTTLGTLNGDLVINAGTVKGNGVVNGSVTNGGTLAPGSSPGTFFIDGDYDQTGTGVLEIEIDAIDSFDVLEITGQATLAGTLSVTQNFAPMDGDSFTVITYDSLMNDFTSFTGLDIVAPFFRLEPSADVMQYDLIATDLTPASDTTPPDVTLTAGNVTMAGTFAHPLTLDITDDTDVDTDTLDNFDLVVMLPGGGFQAVSFDSFDDLDGSIGGNYLFSAPGGSWGIEDNGTYTVMLVDGEIGDTLGNFASAQTLGAFQVNIPDTTKPVGTLVMPVGSPTFGSTAFTFSITFTDNVSLDASSILNQNNVIHIDGPGAFDGTATFVSATPMTNSNSITATYSFAAPEGVWDAGATGTYTVQVVAGSVDDTSANSINAADLGTFSFNGGNTFVVINTADAGGGSLRRAITASNAHSAAAIIQFAIPTLDSGFGSVGAGANAYTITLLSQLPAMTNPLGANVNGASQTGNPNPFGPDVILNGASAGGGSTGLMLMSDHNTVQGLVIRSFSGAGIEIYGDTNHVMNNYIGTSALGTAAQGNSGGGVVVYGANNTIGGTATSDANIISGNSVGVVISGDAASGNTLYRNLIGTDRTGEIDLGNSGFGVVIEDGAFSNIIGSATNLNVISGNNAGGVEITGYGSDSNNIVGNNIGVDDDGLQPIGNTGPGVLITDGAGSNLVSNNVIGANTGSGVQIRLYTGVSSLGGEISIDAAIEMPAFGNSVLGNAIGTDRTRTVDLGNGGAGVLLTDYASQNIIGGVTGTQPNIITNNDGGGVVVNTSAGVENPIRGNAIYNNTGLGIDLGATGPTANDAQDVDAEENAQLEQSGFANTLQNYPVITAVSTGSTIVSGTLNSTPVSTFTLDFYINTAADASGFGEGQNYIGSTVVVTDANGDASFSNVVFATTVLDGQFVTATATDTDGNTSEFSAAFEVDLIVDVAPPTAQLTLANTVTVPGTQQHFVEVTYSDDIAVDPSTFDVTDITVTGPGGSLNVASVVVFNNTPGTPRVVRYLLDPPGGSWDNSDNGTYTVALNNGAVMDTASKGNLAVNLGSFSANLPPPPDPENPTAVLIAMNVTTPGQAFVDFMVAYTDNVAIDATTIGSNDVMVQTPDGTMLPVTFIGVNDNTDGSPRKATYRFTAPGDGTFDVADNGTYTVIMVAGGVLDTAGNDVAAGALGNFQVALTDNAAPVAFASAANINVGGGLTYQFTITYSDNTSIDVSTLDDNDIMVRLPDSVTLLPARFISVTPPGNGSPRTATYEIDAPRSPLGFGAPDDGTYTIEISANQVFDTASSPNAVAPGAIGTFTVNLAGQPTVEVVNGTLFIVGTENPDNIAVMAMGDGLVQVTIQPSGFVQKYSGVTDINVMGLAGNDVITIDPSTTAANGSPMAGFYDGGEGDDIINASGGDDTILLGPGDDTVNGGAGEDTVLAVGTGGGFDMIHLTGPRLAIFNGDTITLGSDIEKVDIDFAQSGDQSAIVDASFLIDAVNYMGGPAVVGSTDTLSIVDDLGVPQSITLGDNVVNVAGGGNPQTIMATGLTALNVTTNGGVDTVTIPTTAAGIAPTISLNAGSGAAGDDVRVEGSNNADVFAVHPSFVTVNGVAVNLTAGFDLTLAGLLGNDTYQLFDGWYSHMIEEGVSEGAADTLDASNVTTPIDFNIGSVTATSGGSVSSHAQSNIENLIGGSNDDNFIFADQASIAGGIGTIDGGPGTDTLDYTAYTTPVFANLGTGQGTGVSSFTSIENLEGVGPTATLQVEDIVQAGGDIHLLTVTYTGAGSPIQFNTIGDGDLTIVGPGGDMFIAEFIGVDLLADGNVRTATYALRAGGLLGNEFDDSDNGTYHVLLNANQVQDTGGNSAKAGELGTFDIAINGARPVATTDPANIGFPGTTYLFDVVYTDPDGLIDTDTLGHDDILVTSSANGGFAQYATFVDADINEDGSVVTATYRLIAPGGLWTTANNGVYQIQVIGDVADDAGNLVAKTLVGLFRVKIAPGDSEVASNLVGQLGSLPPDALVRPGDKGSVDLKITNQGPDPVDQIITIELFASHDSIIGEGDIPIGQTTKRIKLNVGQMVTVRVNFELPNDLPFGDYQIIALMDTTDAVPGDSQPVATDNMITVDNRFGNVDGKRAKLTLRDNDGTLVTFTLSGDGTGMVEQTAQGFNVVIDGASSNTSVNVTARGGNGKANIHDVTVNGSIKSFKATKSIIKGDVTITGSAKTLGLDIVDANHVISIGAPANPNDQVTITGSEWTDTSLLTQTNIRSLKLKKWTDTNATPDVLEAPAVGTIKIGEVVGVDMSVDGDVKAVDVNNWSTGALTADTLGRLNDKGDLDITLRLIGPTPSNGKTLGNTNVKGQASGKWVIESGNTGTINIGSAAAGFSASIAGESGNFTSKGDFDGVLAAAGFNKVTIQGNTTQARILAGANLGADGMLGGGDDSFVAGDLSFLRVKGNALASIFAAGLNPADGIFNNGDDTLAAPSGIGNVLIDGTLSNDSLIAASTLPAVVKVNGASVTTSTDPRFLDT